MSISNPGKQGLSGKEKGMIALVVVVILIAAFVIYRTIKAQQPQVVDVKTQPPGSALKLQAMKAMKERQAGQVAPGAAQTGTGNPAIDTPPGVRTNPGTGP